jgi:hypothetical protein
VGCMCVGVIRKGDLRAEKKYLESMVALVRSQQDRMLRDLGHQRKDMEMTLKQLRDQLFRFNKVGQPHCLSARRGRFNGRPVADGGGVLVVQMYEDLIFKKETKLYIESMNDKVGAGRRSVWGSRERRVTPLPPPSLCRC